MVGIDGSYSDTNLDKDISITIDPPSVPGVNQGRGSHFLNHRWPFDPIARTKFFPCIDLALKPLPVKVNPADLLQSIPRILIRRFTLMELNGGDLADAGGPQIDRLHPLFRSGEAIGLLMGLMKPFLDLKKRLSIQPFPVR